MAKRDAYKRTMPITINYREKELASSQKIQAFQKMSERAFNEFEKAIGDIHNTENAINSPLSSYPLYINSIGRVIGSMADIEPILSGINEYSPILANNMKDMTYNVIPNPNQSIRLEVGCKYDSLATPESTTRSCLKSQDAFYLQVQGTNTGICQNTSCPFWSARDGLKVNSSICQPDGSSETYREYKLVLPKEKRNIIQSNIKFYSNCGIEYDKYRTDDGTSAFGTNRSDPSQSWALATNNSIATSGISEEIKYEYPGLTSTYNAVIEIPAVDTDQIISVNNITIAQIQGTSTNATRYFMNLEAFTNISSLRISIKPATTSTDNIAAISQIWIIENTVRRHYNYNIPLLLPKALDTLSAGTEIPANFLQVFDTQINVNTVLDHVRTFSSRFNPKSSDLNLQTFRDSFDITIYGDQKLEIGNDRYLGVTTGAPLTSVVGALLYAFVDHTSDTEIHLNREQICELLSDKSFCCDGRLKASISNLYPSSKIAPTAPATYRILSHIYGGFPPYTVVINWGDSLSDSLVTPTISSGIQIFELTSDRRPPLQAYEFSHDYDDAGTYSISFDITDDASVFGCSKSLTSQVSPFNVGNPPVMDSEIRLDYATSYPSFAYQDITAGYNFTTTEDSEWTLNPQWHVLTQVHNTDIESGKPDEYYWKFKNSEALTFKFQYEDISGVQETINFTNSSGVLSNDLIQQDSVVITKGSSVFVQGTDYSVDWTSGIIQVTGSGIPANASSYIVRYNHYLNAANLTAVQAGQWVNLGSETNALNIDLSNLTNRVDLNTIRFKIKD